MIECCQSMTREESREASTSELGLASTISPRATAGENVWHASMVQSVEFLHSKSLSVCIYPQLNIFQPISLFPVLFYLFLNSWCSEATTYTKAFRSKFIDFTYWSGNWRRNVDFGRKDAFWRWPKQVLLLYALEYFWGIIVLDLKWKGEPVQFLIRENSERLWR